MRFKIRKCKTCKTFTSNQTSMSGAAVTYVCSKCRGLFVRPITVKERAKFMAEVLPLRDPAHNVHHVFHEFSHKFSPYVPTGETYKDWKGKVCPRMEEKWKWTGYDLMERVAQWAKKYPKFVTITRCDDDYHSGSNLVLIEHRKLSGKDRYMGTSVIYIPQCNGDKPTRLFLYPSHHDELIRALGKTRTRNKKSWDSYNT